MFPESSRRVPRQKTVALHCTAHIHHATVYTAFTPHTYTIAPTPFTYTAPQHLPCSPTPHHSTYTADMHHIHASIVFSLVSKGGVGLAGVGGMHPSAGFVRVRALSLWRHAWFQRGRRTPCRFRASRSALAVAPCEFSTSPANPLRVSCVLKCCRCGAVRILNEPSAGFVRVETLSLWRHANLKRRLRTLCGFRAC